MDNSKGRRRRFGAVRELKSGQWQARYRGPDGPMRPADRTFPSKTEAEIWLTRKEAEILNDEWSRGRGKDRRKGFTETDYARLLDAAHQQPGGPLVVIWDNLNTHVSAAMKELIAARDWLTVYQLPPYAHELNPVELVWSHLKRSLANLAKRNIAQLTALVRTRLKRMQYRPTLLDGFLASTRLDLTPFRNPHP